MRPCDKNLLNVLEYVKRLLSMADKGDLEREDYGCGVVFGIVRDSAYKIKDQIEKEIEKHKRLGKWDKAI